MSDWKSQGEQGSGQGLHGREHGQQGAWVWVKWNDEAPKDAWKEWNKGDLKGFWGASDGEWHCKIWVPAQSKEEAQQYVDNKISNNKWVKDTKTEWNWNWCQWAA